MVRRTKSHAFTLVEILIVVIILGILAAIVIPQFTNASADARKVALFAELKQVRQQIQLYKLQHNDQLPDITADWTALTGTSVVNGVTYGPYLQSAPKNPLISDQTANTLVTDGDGSLLPMGTTAYFYDLSGGTGNFIAANDDGTPFDETTVGQ